MKQLQRRIFYHLPPSLRFAIRKIWYWPRDILDKVIGNRPTNVPSRGDNFVGRGDFRKHGIRQLNLLKSHIDLKPDDVVLDIGCGIGRTAVALTTYLSNQGRYEGFDVVKRGIDWCNKHIKTDFSNFNFIYIPLHNDLYNQCEGKAESYRFPYQDNFFDKVMVYSVFTHMSVKEIANYLYEIKRVLKPGGQCLSTFFIYSHHNEAITTNNADFSFSVDKGRYRLMNEIVESANIALRWDLLKQLIKEADLQNIKWIEGYWKESTLENDENEFQDIVVFNS